MWLHGTSHARLTFTCIRLVGVMPNWTRLALTVRLYIVARGTLFFLSQLNVANFWHFFFSAIRRPRKRWARVRNCPNRNPSSRRQISVIKRHVAYLYWACTFAHFPVLLSIRRFHHSDFQDGRLGSESDSDRHPISFVAECAVVFFFWYNANPNCVPTNNSSVWI